MADEQKGTPMTCQIMVNPLAANDQLKELAKSQSFSQTIQAMVQWIASTLEAGWERELIVFSMQSNAGVLHIQCTLTREKLIQEATPGQVLSMEPNLRAVAQIEKMNGESKK